MSQEKMQIGHLMAKIGRLNASRTDRFMEQIGLYRGQAILLIILSRKDGLTHSELAEKLEISPAAVTKVIQRLEKLNYLRRQSDPADERVSRVYLLDEGRAVIQKIRHVFAEMDQILVGDLSADDQDALLQLLMRVYANLLEQPCDM